MVERHTVRLGGSAMRIADVRPHLFTCGTLEANIYHLVASWEIDGTAVFRAMAEAGARGPITCPGCAVLVALALEDDSLRFRVDEALFPANIVITRTGGFTSVELRSGGMRGEHGEIPSPDTPEFRELSKGVARALDSVALEAGP